MGIDQFLELCCWECFQVGKNEFGNEWSGKSGEIECRQDAGTIVEALAFGGWALVVGGAFASASSALFHDGLIHTRPLMLENVAYLSMILLVHGNARKMDEEDANGLFCALDHRRGLADKVPRVPASEG